VILAAKRVNPQSLMHQFSDKQGWIWAIVVVVLVLVLLLIVLKLREWLRKGALSESSPEQLLLEFRKIHSQGELSADEYKTIREQLFQKSGQAGHADNAGGGPSAGDSVGSSQSVED